MTKNILKKEIAINISEKNKSFVWFGRKTASTFASNVLHRYDFIAYENVNNVLRRKNRFIHNHMCFLFPGHENYKFIATARNPYARLVSLFLNSNYSENNDIKFNETYNKFQDFVTWYFFENPQQLDGNNDRICFDYSKRVPDYFIRQENMYEDYCKIPFINESEFNTSGELKVFCNVKLNEGEYSGVHWKDFLSQDSADTIFYNSLKYFDLVGYDKDSWK
jgi:hypothetical protein